MKNIKNFNVLNKRVLVRCDLDALVDEKGNILDDFKIQKSLPTIKYLLENRAKIILMASLGNPGGKFDLALKLDKVAEKLSKYLDTPIIKEEDCVGPQIENRNQKLEAGEILMLENLKFHKEETDGDLKFAEQLSWLGDIYINDDFSNINKVYASITGITKYIPSGIGLSLQEDLDNLNKILQNPKKPFVVIIGGIATDIKLNFINKISESADYIIVNGLIKIGMAEKGILFKYQNKIISQTDFSSVLDIDEKTIKTFLEKITTAKTVLWTGPFGKIEEARYQKGTLAIAKGIIKSSLFSVIGGESTTAFLKEQGLMLKSLHIYEGGESMMQYLSRENLPGLSTLN